MSTTSAFSTTKPRTAFIPPTFGNIGRNVKDLFKKNYDFTHSLKTIHKSSGGVTFESGVLSDSAPLRGYVRAKSLTPRYELEAEANTDPSNDTKASIRFPRAYPGLALKLSTTLNSKGSVYTGEAEYITEGFSATTVINSDLSSHRAQVSLSAGIEGVTIGGIISTDLTNGADITDYNLGVSYNQPNYVASIYTENQADTATLSYYHSLSSQHAVGGSLTVDIGGQKTGILTFGNDYMIDSQTKLKTKVEAPTGIVTTALEHRLKNPSALISIAAAYQPLTFTKGVKADKFGIGVTFGDY